MLAGELDSKNCYLSINAGAGGTEACDWALMLARMWESGREAEVVDTVDGDVAGIKSMTIKLTVTLLMDMQNPKKACIAWCASHPLMGMHAGTPRLPLFLSTQKLPKT